MRGRRVPPMLPPSPNPDPFARLVTAVAGSPFARILRDIVDQAMASPVLPRRTKLLMIAVIARAVGCAYCESETRAGLGVEGLDSGAVDEILAILGSAKLDGRDALLIPFARETVRYQIAGIQRRTRNLARELTTEEVIEAVGIAALANSLARLSVVLEPC